MLKINKKGMELKVLAKLLLLVVFLIIVLNVFLNPDFFYDMSDRIKNLFNPPEKDPVPWQRQDFNNRRDAVSMFTTWVNAYNAVLDSSTPCYKPVSFLDNFFDNQFSMSFTPSDNGFEMQLFDKDFPIVEPITINSRLCFVADFINTEESKKSFEDMTKWMMSFNPTALTEDRQVIRATYNSEFSSNNNVILTNKDSSSAPYNGTIFIGRQNNRDYFNVIWSSQNKINTVNFRIYRSDLILFILIKSDKDVCFVPFLQSRSACEFNKKHGVMRERCFREYISKNMDVCS